MLNLPEINTRRRIREKIESQRLNGCYMSMIIMELGEPSQYDYRGTGRAQPV
jgi:hypothetical protein